MTCVSFNAINVWVVENGGRAAAGDQSAAAGDCAGPGVNSRILLCVGCARGGTVGKTVNTVVHVTHVQTRFSAWSSSNIHGHVGRGDFCSFTLHCFDLQTVIALVRNTDLGQPFQFDNFRD